MQGERTFRGFGAGSPAVVQAAAGHCPGVLQEVREGQEVQERLPVPGTTAFRWEARDCNSSF